MHAELQKLVCDIVELRLELRRKLGLEAAIAAVAMPTTAELQPEPLLQWLLSIRPRHLLTIPFIYGMLIPLATVDLCLSLYQFICFPIYGIARVRRADYIKIDRHRLPYLNAIEKLHCAYCGYINGLIGYLREVAARTEQFWCPIKHEHQFPGVHHLYANFLDYGDGKRYHEELERLRASLAEPATNAPGELKPVPARAHAPHPD